MKNFLMILFFAMFSVSTQAAQPIPPLFEIRFTTSTEVLQTIGQEAEKTNYLEELEQDLTVPVVYVSDILDFDKEAVKGKFVLLERDGKSSFADKMNAMRFVEARGVIVMNTDDSLFMMGGGFRIDIYGLLIPNSIGVKIREQLLNGQPVQITIPVVLDKTM
jgi:hypothetical protein